MAPLLRRLTAGNSFSKFLIVGGLSFGVDYGLLLVLHRGFDVQLNLATTLAFLVGLAANFLLNKIWTFKAPRGMRQSALQAAQYGLLVVFNIVITNVIVGGAHLAGIQPEWSKPAATALLMIVNYVLYRQVIFRTSSTDASAK